MPDRQKVHQGYSEVKKLLNALRSALDKPACFISVLKLSLLAALSTERLRADHADLSSENFSAAFPSSTCICVKRSIKLSSRAEYFSDIFVHRSLAIRGTGHAQYPNYLCRVVTQEPEAFQESDGLIAARLQSSIAGLVKSTGFAPSTSLC